MPVYLEGCSEFWRPRALALLLTGMRMGELCGLRWEDVDRGGQAIIVRRALKRDRSIGSTKGDETGRRVDIGPALLAALAHERASASERDQAQLHALVFPGPGGEDGGRARAP